MKKILLLLTVITVLISAGGVITRGAASKELILKNPDKTGGIPLMQALAKRQSSRSFAATPLTEQVLSNLLWAADGVNRPQSNKRTAPTAMNNQEIDIYAAMADGTYLYNAKKHTLTLVIEKDLRPLTGSQGFVNKAPLNLIYVANIDKAAGGNREEKLIYAGADPGFIGQNVYLYCASEGLSTVIRGWIDKKALGKALGLKSSEEIILSQTVGYPGN